MSSGLRVAIRELANLPEVFRAPTRSEHEVRSRALAGVNRMLEHCRNRVPHYAELPLPPCMDSLDELGGLPVLTKSEVLTKGVDDFRDSALPAPRVRTDVTSGTTGTRLEIWHDVNAYGYHGATVLRRFLRSGYRPWWRIAQIKPFSRPVRWFQRIGIFPRVVIGAGQSEEAIAAQVVRARPRLLMGYPLVLRGILRVISPEDLQTLRSSLRMVMTDSELLTDEAAELLREGFGVPVFDEYSAYEVLTVSSQCRDGSMHLDEDRVWLEILDEDGRLVPDGQDGLVTVTHFRERAMPLVRYQLGDRGRIVPGPCSCGSGFRRMAVTEGRSNDYIVLPGGRRIYSGVFLSLAMFSPGVAECMIRQDETGRVSVRLVPETAGEAAWIQAVTAFRDSFADLVDEPVELEFLRASRVDLTPGGKGRFVESSYRPGFV
ncbi:MAG: hypothetical protein L0H93_14245 [Nocardioides sp.]|nr:hypothetical protein [Nocardioides sp.]